MSGWTVALLASTALHAGFQLTVTALVYPALAAQPPGSWAAAHARHSGAITPLVALVYGAALVSCAGVVATGTDAAGLVAVAATLVAFAVTAALAAPTHGRLAGGPDPALLARLLSVDRWRCVAAVLAAAAALVSALA